MPDHAMPRDPRAAFYGEQIAAERTARQWSQGWLAELIRSRGCDASQSAVSRWELGDVIPTDAQKVCIALVFDRDPGEMFPLVPPLRGAA